MRPTERQSDHQRAVQSAKRPWTIDDYERLKNAAIALCRTHITWYGSDGSIRPSFDGKAYWQLLGALDRSGPDRFPTKQERNA